MAALRALLIFAAVAGFFLIGVPLQVALTRVLPRTAHLIPILFCRTLLALLKVEVEVTGERTRGGPVLIASNHVSWIDILALGRLMPFCFLAKSDVAAWPVVSAFAGVQGTVFVDRKRRRSILQANRDMADRMLQGRAVLLFPEATTIAGPPPGKFHSSHVAAARDLLRRQPGAGTVSIQPVALAYSSPAAAWVGDDDLLSHVWRTLRAPALTCRIAFAPPIAYGPGSDRKQVTQAAREAIIALIDAPPLSCRREEEAPLCGTPAIDTGLPATMGS